MRTILYVPFSKENLPKNYQQSMSAWVKNKTNIELIYPDPKHPGKSLKDLPDHTQINLLIPGQPGKAPLLSGLDKVDSQCLKHFPKLSRHYRIKENEWSIFGPETAEMMIAEGLLDNFQGHIQINLVFLDTAKTVTASKAFRDTLYADKRGAEGSIRTDTHYSRNGTQKTYTYYNQAHSFTLENAKKVVKKYNAYKSSRACGLSGLLGLNGLFSSDASKKAIERLMNANISDTDRFNYAFNFMTECPNSQLAKNLNPYYIELMQKKVEQANAPAP